LIISLIFLIKKTNAVTKNSKLTSVLDTHLQGKINLARLKLFLSIDRTNWKFGQTNINIFMLGLFYKNASFPPLFIMLDKRENSNSQERIDFNRYDSLCVGLWTTFFS
jgi:hypothetical protein